ncbi:MAG: hypothetical protein LUE92_16965, partial [Clostridiales bacterium]|nr:hypothetical protein [Clostridiales bacterium]
MYQYMSAESFERGIDNLFVNKLANKKSKFYIIDGENYASNPDIEDIISILEQYKIDYDVLKDIPVNMTGVVFDYKWRMNKDLLTTEEYYGMPKLFADYGEGFCDSELALQSEMDFDKEQFFAEYSLEAAPWRIKLVPSTRQYCIINSLSILTEYGNLDISSHNGVAVDQLYCFPTYQSEIICNNPEHACFFRVKAEIHFFRGFLEFSLLDKLQKLSRSVKQSKKMIEQKDAEIQKLVSLDAKTKNDYDIDLLSDTIIESWRKYYKYSMLI